MRYAIFADVHANLEALAAVFDALEQQAPDECVCVGDLVGYGADPEACVDLVRAHGCLCVAGNHDHAALGCADTSEFNLYARESAAWTGRNISKQTAAYLARLGFVEHAPEAVFVHGSLDSPESFSYIQTVRDAQRNLALLDKPLLFCAHSHIPVAFLGTEPPTYSLDAHIGLEQGVPTIVNVGSVGQPRDEEPRAAYAIYDTEAAAVHMHRVPYDVDTASRKILDAGLPEILAQRLRTGN